MMQLKRSFLFAALAFLALAPLTSFAQTPVRTIVDFNADWKFLQGDQARGKKRRWTILPGAQ